MLFDVRQNPLDSKISWLERLADFDFQIIHKPGRLHSNADSLSRIPCQQCGLNMELITVTTAAIHEHILNNLNETKVETPLSQLQEEDDDLRIVRTWFLPNKNLPHLEDILRETEKVKRLWQQRYFLQLKDEVLYRETLKGNHQLLVPAALKKEFLTRAHTGITGGHPGIRQTRFQVRQRTYWIG